MDKEYVYVVMFELRSANKPINYGCVSAHKSRTAAHDLVLRLLSDDTPHPEIACTYYSVQVEIS